MHKLPEFGTYHGQKITVGDKIYQWCEERRFWKDITNPSTGKSSAEQGGFKPKHPGDMPGFYKG